MNQSTKPLASHSVAGFFQPGTFKNVIALDLGATPSHAGETAFHEFIHLLLSYHDFDYPLWIDEGMAEFYGNLQLGGGVSLGRPQRHHIEVLATSQWIPVARLLLADEGSEEYNDPARKRVFYAQAWALIHYFVIERAEGDRELQEFLQLLTEGTRDDAALSAATGLSFGELQRELEQYVGRDRFTYLQFDTSEMDFDEEVVSRPLSEAEVTFHQAELLLHTNRLEEAELYLRAALEEEPGLTAAHESLGFLRLQQGDPVRAAARLEEAIRRKTSNHLVYYHYALLLTEAYRAPERRGQMPASRFQKASSALRTSLRLAPDFADAARVFGLLYLLEGGSLDEAEAVLARRSSRRPELVYLLGEVYQRAGRLEEAREAMKRVRSLARDERMRDEALRELERVEKLLAGRAAPF